VQEWNLGMRSSKSSQSLSLPAIHQGNRVFVAQASGDNGGGKSSPSSLVLSWNDHETDLKRMSKVVVRRRGQKLEAWEELLQLLLLLLPTVYLTPGISSLCPLSRCLSLLGPYVVGVRVSLQ